MAGDAPTAASIRERATALEEALEAAETESELDDIEPRLDELEADVETLAATLTEQETDDDTEAESEQPDIDALEETVETLRATLTDCRGPYASDVVDTLEEAISSIKTQELTANGRVAVQSAVNEALSEMDVAVDQLTADNPAVAPIIEHLSTVQERIAARETDPDADADWIQRHLAAVDALTEAIDDAEVWDDLTVQQKLEQQGFYDIVEERRDFPPELSAIKAYEKRGEAEPILLALDMLDSDFMEEYCMEALGRLRATEAVDELTSRANRRNETAIEALGRIGSDEAVDALLKHIDGNLALQVASLRALGQVGSPEPVPDIAEVATTGETAQVRSMAARALGMIGDTRAIPVLEQLLTDDNNPIVRQNAGWALSQIQTPRALAAVERHPDAQSLRASPDRMRP